MVRDDRNPKAIDGSVQYHRLDVAKFTSAKVDAIAHSLAGEQASEIH
jgi:hypothetical protein